MKSLVALLIASAIATQSNTAFAAVDVRTADQEMYPSNVQLDPAIPSPADFLGFELGLQPVRHHQLVDYITTVANLSDRMSVEIIGYSHERRPILFLVVTSPENRRNLDTIKAQHVALSEPDQAQPITPDMPVVTWLNYGVHGAEASGMDASLPFIYYLAAAEGPEIERILDESVVLVTAVFNPDGHAKRIAWVDAYGGERLISDPAHAEHQYNGWMARTNHYWFDLNRQWLLVTQPEPRAWMRKWHEWRPNLTVDYHEMGSSKTYYFHPGVATRTNPLVPAEAERLMAETAKTSEAVLDAEGRLYYHGEDFDNFYVGKGSTFPLINGGVGILYEAASAVGREIDTANGLRTYRENIRKHFRTSIASIVAAAGLRDDYLNYQKQFYLDAAKEAAAYASKAWVFSAAGDAARLNQFADLLSYHRIKTYRPGRDIEVGEQQFVAEQSLIVPLAQAQHRLLRSLFEPTLEFADSTFYDVSTWALPPAFGLQQASLAGRQYRDSLLGDEYQPTMQKAPTPDESRYAYAFEWNAYYAPRALQRILESGLLARVATKPFSASTTQGPNQFSRGSVVVPFDRQSQERSEIHALMQTIAAKDGITVHALTSGRSTTGTAGADVGGSSFRPAKMPKVLLLVGDSINLYDAGEIWHLLDYRMQMPVTLRARESLAGIKWDDYTHIVFPAGTYENYEADFAARLRLWIAEGGTAVALRNAAPWLRANTLDWVDPADIAQSAQITTTQEAAEGADDKAPVERTPYSEKDSLEATDLLGGAIFSADLDISHPLGFGYQQRQLFLHKNFRDVFAATDNPFSTVIAYDEEPVYSGYVSASNSTALAKTPALIAERSGAGSVILFADNPNFRGYWYGTNKLFLNALFFSTLFDPPADY